MTIYRVGMARRVITAPLGLPHLAYEPRLQPFIAVRDDLEVIAWSLSDGRTECLVVSVDLIGLGRGLLPDNESLGAALRRRISEALQLPVSHVMVCATHTHASPETTGITRPLPDAVFEDWLDQLADRVVEAAVAARRDAGPTRLRTATVSVPEVATVRRHRAPGAAATMQATPDTVPTTMIDESLTALVADRVDGSSAVLLSFACHPVALQAQPRMSADYPGQLRRSLEGRGSATIFLQGACGDVNPVDMELGEVSVERSAARLLDAALAGMTAARTNPELSGPIRCLEQSVQLDKRAAGSDVTLSDPVAERNRQDLAARLGPQDVPYETVVQVFRIATVAICALPGEPFTELGLVIKAMSPASTTVVAGYANDYLGYFAPPAAWLDGGYEVGCGPWALVDGSAAHHLCRTTDDLLHQLWAPPPERDSLT